MTSTKITRTATTPTLPLPPPSSAMKVPPFQLRRNKPGGLNAGNGLNVNHKGTHIQSALVVIFSVSLATRGCCRLHITGLHGRRCSGDCGATGDHPKFNAVLLTESAVDNGES